MLKRKSTWRTVNAALAVLLLGYAFFMGLTATISYQGPINGQTSRNIFFHVPMWFAMMIMMYTSVVYSIRYLRNNRIEEDIRAVASANVGILFGLLGLSTGIVWSRVTWYAASDGLSAWWAWEPKLTFASICLIIYGAYFLLRRSFEDDQQRARISAVYNIFAAASVYPLLYVLPKALGVQHPGSGSEDSPVMTMSPDYYKIFWPAVLGFICLSIWILDVQARTARLERELEEREYA